MTIRLALAMLIPVLALALQWVLWPWLSPFVWFLFFPAAFLCAHLDGFRGGIVGTVLSALLVWFFFLPPQLSWTLDKPANLASVTMFLVVGYLFSDSQERLRRARPESKDALAEIRFEATFNLAATGIALVAPDGHWLRVNRKLCQIVGYDEAELLALRFQDITHPDDLDTDLDNIRLMLDGTISTYTLEKRYRRKGGAMVWVNLTVALARRPDGSPDYFISVVEDIQRRKEAETALKESARSLQEAQRLAMLGNWAWNLYDDGITWSEEMSSIFGLNPALPPPRYVEIPALFTPESWVRLSVAQATAATEGTPYECDAEVIRPDGSHRWVVSRGEAYRDADGAIAGVHGTVQDITERKAADETLRRQTEELRLRNAELERFNRATVGRELDMIDLKELVNTLSRQLGRDPPFSLGFLDAPRTPTADAAP